MRFICETYLHYVLYALFAAIFLASLAISNFQHKSALTASIWFILLLNKNYMKGFFQLLRTHRNIVITSVSLSFYILASTYTSSGHNNNYLIAGAFIGWIPIYSAACAASIEAKERTLIGLYGTLLLAATIIACSLVWQKFVIGAERPLGLGHNVISGPLICILSILLNDIAKCSRSLTNLDSKAPFIKFISTILIISSLVTDSRTAILCAVVCLFYVTYNEVPKGRLRKIILISIILLLIILFNNKLVDAFSDIDKFINGDLYSSLGSRLEAYKWSYNHFSDHLIFGKSIEGVAESFNSRYIDNSKFVEVMPHLHNDFLQLTAAFGFPTSILFGLFLFMIFQKLRHTSFDYAQERKGSPVFSNGIQLIIVCFFIVSCFDSLTYNTESLLAFVAFIGISLALPVKQINAATHLYATKNNNKENI